MQTSSRAAQCTMDVVNWRYYTTCICSLFWAVFGGFWDTDDTRLIKNVAAPVERHFNLLSVNSNIIYLQVASFWFTVIDLS